MRVSAFIGLAMAAPGTTLDEVLSLADRAIHGAKERGRGVLHVVVDEDQPTVRRTRLSRSSG